MSHQKLWIWFLNKFKVICKKKIIQHLSNYSLFWEIKIAHLSSWKHCYVKENESIHVKKQYINVDNLLYFVKSLIIFYWLLK